MTEVSATLCIAGFNIAILAEGRVHHDHQRKRLISRVTQAAGSHYATDSSKFTDLSAHRKRNYANVFHLVLHLVAPVLV